MRQLRAAITAIALAACRHAAPVPAPAVSADPAVGARPSPDEIARADSTACVAHRLYAEAGIYDLAQLVEREQGIEVVQVALLYELTDPDLDFTTALDLRIELAWRLARAGETDAARAIFDHSTSALGAFDGRRRQLQMLVGDPVDDAALDPGDVPTLVKIGRVDRAREVLAASMTPGRDEDPWHRAGALAALGDTDELERELAAATPDEAHGLAIGWLREALTEGRGIEDAVAAAVAATGNAAQDGYDAFDLLPQAHVAGHGGAVAPYREALRATANAETLLLLYHLALLDGGPDAELAAIEHALDGTEQAAALPVLRAVDRGTLDEGLAAVTAFHGPTSWNVVPRELAVLWGRHVAAGFDPEFDARLLEACRAR